jgi:DNA polymerase kappa
VAAEIRRRVKEVTSLTCSCGVAPNSMLAKICADFNKPDGQCVLPPDLDAITNFMSVLPIRKVPGIGKVCSSLLFPPLSVSVV